MFNRKKECEICMQKCSKKNFWECKVCNHDVCKKCITQIKKQNNLCPFCRSKLPLNIKKIKFSRELTTEEKFLITFNTALIYSCLPRDMSIEDLKRLRSVVKRRRNQSRSSMLLYDSLNIIIVRKKLNL